VTAVSVSVAAIYYILTLRAQQRNMKHTLETRQAQLFMDLYKRDESVEFQTIWWEILGTWKWNDVDGFVEKYSYLSGDAAPYGKMMSVLSHYEGMATLMRRGLLSPDLVYDINYNGIIMFWDKFSGLIYEWRKMFDSPQMFEAFEWLQSEMRRIRESKGHGVFKIPEKYQDQS